jgi:hypothetical protein
MTDTGPTAAEVLQAIKRSGYLLEQDVAISLEALGFHVETGAAYQDADEGKSREIDVLAYRSFVHDEKRRFSVVVETICECKNTTNPYVFIGRKRVVQPAPEGYLAPPEFVFPRREYEVPIRTEQGHQILASGFDRFGLASLHYYHGLGTKTVQFCRLVRKDRGWGVDQGGVYDSLVYPMAKALLARQKLFLPDWTPAEGAWRQIRIFVPLVVLAGPLFYIDSSSEERTPRQVTHATYGRRLEAETIQGTFTIDFVSFVGLTDFVTQKVEPFAQHVVAIAEKAGEALFSGKL